MALGSVVQKVAAAAPKNALGSLDLPVYQGPAGKIRLYRFNGLLAAVTMGSLGVGGYHAKHGMLRDATGKSLVPDYVRTGLVGLAGLSAAIVGVLALSWSKRYATAVHLSRDGTSAVVARTALTGKSYTTTIPLEHGLSVKNHNSSFDNLVVMRTGEMYLLERDGQAVRNAKNLGLMTRARTLNAKDLL
jgi:hypothetical protein